MAGARLKSERTNEETVQQDSDGGVDAAGNETSANERDAHAGLGERQ